MWNPLNVNNRTSHATGDRLPRPSVGLAVLSLATFTGLSLLPTTAAQARFIWWERVNEYEICARELLEAGLPDSDVADACGEALHPADLSECVLEIEEETAIAPETALASCKRVRRPVDLASCVIDIDEDTERVIPLNALDYCRRSLLPLTFSDCVLGLREELLDLDPIPAMDVCITADDRPVEYLLDFVFSDPGSGVTTPQGTMTDPSIRLTPLIPLNEDE